MKSSEDHEGRKVKFQEQHNICTLGQLSLTWKHESAESNKKEEIPKLLSFNCFPVS